MIYQCHSCSGPIDDADWMFHVCCGWCRSGPYAPHELTEYSPDLDVDPLRAARARVALAAMTAPVPAQP